MPGGVRFALPVAAWAEPERMGRVRLRRPARSSRRVWIRAAAGDGRNPSRDCPIPVRRVRSPGIAGRTARARRIGHLTAIVPGYRRCGHRFALGKLHVSRAVCHRCAANPADLEGATAYRCCFDRRD